MFTNQTKTINGTHVTLISTSATVSKTVYFARGPLHDYYIIRSSARRFDVETYDDRWIDEASTLEDACKIIMEFDEGLVPW